MKRPFRVRWKKSGSLWKGAHPCFNVGTSFCTSLLNGVRQSHGLHFLQTPRIIVFDQKSLLSIQIKQQRKTKRKKLGGGEEDIITQYYKEERIFIIQINMGHHSCCNQQKVKRGLWSPEEDEKLIRYITTHGYGCWSEVPEKAGHCSISFLFLFI